MSTAYPDGLGAVEVVVLGSYLTTPPGTLLLGGTITLLLFGGTIKLLLPGGTTGGIPPGGAMIFDGLAGVGAGEVIATGGATGGGTVTVFKKVNGVNSPGS